jgi:cytochrome c oxidase assembly protein subunit 15
VPAAERLFFDTPWWRNLFENLLTVQFEHRMVAYVLFVVALWHLVDAMRSGAAAQIVRGAAWLAAGITAQATLGILTLLNQAPLDLALTHQAMALVVVALAVAQLERLTPLSRPAAAAERPLDLAKTAP